MTKIDMTSATAVFAMIGTFKGVDLGALDKRIDYIGTTGKKLDAAIHAAAVGCIVASMAHDKGGHNCVIRAHRLLSAMPKGSRAQTLADWMEAFSNIRAKRDSKTGLWVVGNLKPTAKGYRADLDVKGAFDKPFWDVAEKTKGAEAFDLGAMIAMLKRKVDSATKDGSIDAKDAEAAAKLLAFAAANDVPMAKRAAPVAAAA